MTVGLTSLRDHTKRAAVVLAALASSAMGLCQSWEPPPVHLEPSYARLVEALYTETSREALLEAAFAVAGAVSPEERETLARRVLDPSGSVGWATATLQSSETSTLERAVAARVLASTVSSDLRETVVVYSRFPPVPPERRDWESGQMSGRMDHYASCPLPVLSASREVIRDFLPGLSTQLSEEVVREIRSLLPQDPRAYFADDTRDHARLLLDVYLAQTGDPAPLSVLWPDASAEPTPGEIGHMIQALWRGSHVRHSMAMAQ